VAIDRSVVRLGDRTIRSQTALRERLALKNVPIKKLVAKSMQRYWRATRGLTMGAQGVVFDAQGRVLLIRHGYRVGWHFPGGGVERNQTAAAACARELLEETGVICDQVPELFGLYANFKAFPSDHIALFRIASWHQPTKPSPNREIAEQGFFAPDALPEGTIAPVHRRIAELLDGTPPAETW
jgi:8-oxo-dGTP pyrophosphatase MutT (NUDIX family)